MAIHFGRDKFGTHVFFQDSCAWTMMDDHTVITGLLLSRTWRIIPLVFLSLKLGEINPVVNGRAQ